MINYMCKCAGLHTKYFEFILWYGSPKNSVIEGIPTLDKVFLVASFAFLQNKAKHNIYLLLQKIRLKEEW